MAKRIFPVGAIIFLHEDCPSEHVPYMDEDEMAEALQSAIDQKLNPNSVWPYVDPKQLDLAKRLYDIAGTDFDKNFTVYALTPENIHLVLADYTYIIQPQYA